MQCPTMQVKSEPCPDNLAGFVVINVEDFDPETMTKHEPEAPPAPPALPGGATPPWSK
jgi:hypothetical protein